MMTIISDNGSDNDTVITTMRVNAQLAHFEMKKKKNNPRLNTAREKANVQLCDLLRNGSLSMTSIRGDLTETVHHSF